jgi:Zn-finger nucleic acid-binding protein
VFAWPDALTALHPMLSRIAGSRYEAMRSPEHGMGTRHCAGCDGVPRALSFFEVPIDWCPECGGVWLDGGEADALRATVEALRREVGDNALNPYRVSANAAAQAIVLGTVTCARCAARVAVNATYVTSEGVLCVPCGRRLAGELPSPENEAEVAEFLDNHSAPRVGPIDWLLRLFSRATRRLEP